LLVASDIDMILVETMINLAEVKILSELLSRNEIPFIMSFTSQNGVLLDGTPLGTAADYALKGNALALLVNCRPVDTITQELQTLRAISKGWIGAYGNGPGAPDDVLGWRNAEGSTDLYCQVAEEWVRHGAVIIGGCCGTTPSHITGLYHLRNRISSVL
jgi:homocysteine S-methyltransferase